jgi:hypothetical protein
MSDIPYPESPQPGIPAPSQPDLPTPSSAAGQLVPFQNRHKVAERLAFRPRPVCTGASASQRHERWRGHEGATHNVKDAIAAWFEEARGREVPPPARRAA